MPTFISDDEFAVILSTGDVTAASEKADAFINRLFAEIETLKAKADAASITAEQTCSILEHKYLSLTSEFSALESRNSELDSSLQQQSSELALVQSEKHQLHLKFIERDGEIERLKMEVTELQKSKRQLVELVGVKDTEISEKNSTINSYLDKISELTGRATQREARVSEIESELLRSRAHCEKLLQEKELIEKHNVWLNDELTTKADSFLEQRRRSAEIEADLSAKLADTEKQYNECSNSLNWHKERARELESKLESLQRELCSARDDASAAEQRYAAEISTVSKLVDLYKESSEEWSKKAGELEGVIKALETHLSQVECDYKDKVEKEVAARKEAEKEALELTEKISKLEAELESTRRASELDILPLSSFTTDALTFTASSNDNAIVPHVPAGVSGTALAASLLREGWSLTKMYAKYQEAADAFRHEQMGRKQTEAILERVLFEVEEKASVLFDERAEHDRMADAYALMNQKLQLSLSEQANLEKVIRQLKAEVKKCEREYNYAQKEITDLQKQVTILLKECRDVQLRCGSVNPESMDDDVTTPLTEMDDESEIQKVISEHLLSVKDIKGLVEQNAKLRSLVRSLSDEVEYRELQAKEQFKEELQKHNEEAASRVAAVLQRAEEQGQMIESLHSSVSMYKRLYEEEHRLRSSQSQTTVTPSADGRKDFMLLLEGSQEATKRAQEQASERMRCLEDELTSQKAEVISLRSERDKLALEANFTREKLERFVKELDHQRDESNKILVRNIEFSQLIVDYQKKLRESSESVHTAEELSRKLNMEISVLRREKELLLTSEKRAHDEVQDLSQRVYRLQATLDTVQSAEEVREEARGAERKKQEEYIKQIEREWAEAKKEVQEERNNVRTLSLDREHTIKDAMRQVEEMGKRLEAALQAVSAADGRAALAEARYSDLEKKLKLAEDKVDGNDVGLKLPSSVNEVMGDLSTANQEIERLKSEALANKDHMLQYKSIAEVNEAALKQMEAAHESFRIEAEELKKSLEAEIQTLRDRIHELEKEFCLKSNDAATEASQKDEAIASALSEIAILKEETSHKGSQLLAMEVKVSGLKEDLEMAQQQARAVQANYERQVILQSETIQELTKTSQALASVQEEASALRRAVDALKCENNELRAKWGSEKSELDKSKNEAERKYDELNEQNKILHSQLEALHIKLAERDSSAAGVTSATTIDDSQGSSGLQSVVSYLRRSREIAETEISLLKQEKLRLQSQLERAMKASEEAEASLSTERANSRNLLFTEDEFKALKLQVSEMNLLRESNMQLREENRHNFEECHKLREVAQSAKIEAEKLQNILNEKELEIEGLRKEVELCKKEKDNLEAQMFDMCEASKNVNVGEYSRLKSEVEELQASVRAKEAIIVEAQNQISQKQELIAKLDQELTSTRLQLTERDSHLAQIERLKLDIDKQKKINSNYKRKVESLSREKDSLLKEKESLMHEKEVLGKDKDALGKEKESVSKEKEVLLKEKEELTKEKQAISKQLEDLRRDKKATEDKSVDAAMRDTRIKTLENTLTKFRRDRQGIEKSILAKVEHVDSERKKFEDQLEKQKEAVGKISNELEKLKHAKDSLPEGTSVIQLLSENNLDDLAAAYVLAIENFEREAHLVLNDVGNQNNQGSTNSISAVDATPVVASASTIQSLPVEVPVTTPLTAAPIITPAKSTDEREKKVSLPKSRKLVRPRLIKSETPHRNVESSDLDGFKNSGNPTSEQETEKQSLVALSSETLLRKRPASPSPSEKQDDHIHPGDSSTDFPEPSLKKSKGLESLQQDVPAPAVSLENVEELLDAVSDVRQGLTYESSDSKQDVETVEGQGNEAEEFYEPNDTKTLDMESENIINDEYAGKGNEMELMVEELSDLHAEQDVGDKEEGEMLPESSYLDVGDDTTITGSEDATEVQPEHSTAASMPSPSRVDDDALAMDANEVTSPEILNANEQMEEGELAEDAAEDLDKSNNGDEQTVGDADHTMESVVSRESSQDLQQPSHASRTIHISDRAKERAAKRLGLSSSASASDSTTTSNYMPTTRRGRGGPLLRSRGRRGGR
ncbi:nuclear-pore anchor [Silene latifolia]|uniref:nuclear-pore anchor n=1 Tax=Silene latifolia TaxID=37657 RepID=UPI003D772AC9